MKKIITISMMASLFMIGAQSLSAQNYGFETASKWKIMPKFESMVSFTSEQAASGKVSLKFDIADFGENKTVNASTSKKANVTMPGGDYLIKAMVYLGDKAPSAFNINFREPNGGEHQVVNLDISGTPKGEWVEVSTKASLEAINAATMSISIKKNPKNGGSGVLYVDDIEFIKK